MAKHSKYSFIFLVIFNILTSPELASLFQRIYPLKIITEPTDLLTTSIALIKIPPNVLVTFLHGSQHTRNPTMAQRCISRRIFWTIGAERQVYPFGEQYVYTSIHVWASVEQRTRLLHVLVLTDSSSNAVRIEGRL